jgi:hypothetical protein
VTVISICSFAIVFVSSTPSGGIALLSTLYF